MHWEKGTTKPGTTMKVGKSATVRFKADAKHNSLVKLTVEKVRKGKVKDFKRYKLPKSVQRSSIYYVDVQVKNTGTGNLSGQHLTLYGKISKSTVIQPATLKGGEFKPCTDQALPKKFGKGKKATTCLVFFAPHHGNISQIQWRFTKPTTPPVAWKVRK